MTRTGCVVSSLVLVGLVFSKDHGNEFCDLSCKNNEQVETNTVCKRQEMMCGGGPSCGPDFKEIPLTDGDRQYILDIQNSLRSKVAMGKQNYQPAAANMNTLTYNKELEFVAQCWINECFDEILVHDKCRRTSKFSWVGQNLAYIGSTDPSQMHKVPLIKELIWGWFEEVNEYNRSWVDVHQSGRSATGHYSQMVWADTKEVGCAMSLYSSYEGSRKWYNVKMACNYGPGGNWLGQPVYRIGKPATKCTGRKTNKRFLGLCGVDVPVNQTKHYYNKFFNYHI